MYLYRGVVAMILFATALLKFVAVAHHERLLQVLDPLLGVSLRDLAIVAALVEVLVTCFIIVSSRPMSVLVVIQLFSLVLLMYRFGTALSGRETCPCLGGGVAWWPWLDHNQGSLTLGIAVWFWLTSLVLLTRYARQQGTSQHYSEETAMPLTSNEVK